MYPLDTLRSSSLTSSHIFPDFTAISIGSRTSARKRLAGRQHWGRCSTESHCWLFFVSTSCWSLTTGWRKSSSRPVSERSCGTEWRRDRSELLPHNRSCRAQRWKSWPAPSKLQGAIMLNIFPLREHVICQWGSLYLDFVVQKRVFPWLCISGYTAGIILYKECAKLLGATARLFLWPFSFKAHSWKATIWAFGAWWWKVCLKGAVQVLLQTLP